MIFRLRLRRRLLPFLGSLVVGVLSALPMILPDRFEQQDAYLWTFVFLAGVFFFKAYEFAVIRWRLGRNGPRLTIFGLALVDFFLALASLALAFAGFWGILAWYTYQLENAPDSVLNWFRVVITGVGALVLFTGAAVDVEMRRADETNMIAERPDAPAIVTE